MLGVRMNVQTYLYFDGRAENAMALYQKAFGASIEFSMRNKDRGELAITPEGIFTPRSE